MKMKLWIVLPDKRILEIWNSYPNNEWTKEDFDEEVQSYGEIFTKSDRVNIAIINEDGEKETLILWGGSP